MSHRRYDLLNVVIPQGESESAPFSIGAWAFGLLFMSQLDGASYTFKAYDKSTDTFKTIVDSNGDPVVMTHSDNTAGRVPDEVFAAERIMLVSAGSETVERVLSMSVKS